MRVGVLHPGEMGVSVAQALVDAGHQVFWSASGRSQQTLARASAFTRCDDLTSLLSAVDGVVSICPPDAAVAQAQAVSKAGFNGLYLDANAIAPRTAAIIADLFGQRFVDGGIVGPPAVQANSTRLYLSGQHAAEVVEWFDGSKLQCIEISGDVTAASALKMAYAAYTKGASALLLAVNAFAESAGVGDTLQAEWNLSQPGLVARSEQTARNVSRKAWRFVGEMNEIGQSFTDANLPDDFHRGAAGIYARMAGLKGLPPCELSRVLADILNPQ